MAKTIYEYVEDDKLVEEVRLVFRTIDEALKKVDLKFRSNVIDPFSAVFDTVGGNITLSQWEKQEKGRQLQKTMQNAIGYFHQRILGAVGEWHDPGKGGGYDSENEKLKIVAEIKNKWNTMNSSSAKETYNKLAKLLKTTKKGYTGYVVMIIPKTPKRFDKEFRIGKTKLRKDIRNIDGATYYTMVTGDKDGLRKLYEALPEAIRLAKGTSGTKFSISDKDLTDLFNGAYGKQD